MRALVLGVRKVVLAGFAVFIVAAYTSVAEAQIFSFDDLIAKGEGAVRFSLSRVDSRIPSISVTIDIYGKITELTVVRVSRAVSTLKEMGKIASADIPQLADDEWLFEVNLLSSGGSVDAAIETGRILRSLGATVKVAEGMICESSCILILAGGTTRLMKGYIGIHRPYFETPTKPLATAEVSAAMTRMRDKLVAYLSSMNVDRALADDMMKIPPENIRYLTPADLNRYGLLERDPVAEETAALKEASKYGLSRSEYMKRKASIKEVCARPYDKSYADCAAKIFSGNP